MRPKTSAAGFSLVEILIVVAIISLLAGVVLINVAPNIGLGKRATAESQIQAFNSACHTYRAAHGRYPTQEQGLDALVQKPTREPIPRNYPDEGYLSSKDIPLDPWDNPYIYLIPGRQGESFEIISYGRDGEPGGSGEDADISNVKSGS